jgi:hypothetical protein
MALRFDIEDSNEVVSVFARFLDWELSVLRLRDGFVWVCESFLEAQSDLVYVELVNILNCLNNFVTNRFY